MLPLEGLIAWAVFIGMMVIAFKLAILVMIFVVMQSRQNQHRWREHRSFGYLYSCLVCFLIGTVGTMYMFTVSDKAELTFLDFYVSPIVFSVCCVLYFWIGYVWKKKIHQPKAP